MHKKHTYLLKVGDFVRGSKPSRPIYEVIAKPGPYTVVVRDFVTKTKFNLVPSEWELVDPFEARLEILNLQQ